MLRHPSIRTLALVLSATIACSTAPEDDGFDAPEAATDEQTIAGVPCLAEGSPLRLACSGGAPVFTSVVRVGVTGDIGGASAQKFKVEREGSPESITLALRRLRPGTGAGIATFTAHLREVPASGVVPTATSSDLATATLDVAAIGAGPVTLEFSPTGAELPTLDPAKVYAFVFDITASGSASWLVGVASHEGVEAYHVSGPQRRAWRSAGDFTTAAFRAPAGGTVSFSLKSTPPPPPPAKNVCVTSPASNAVSVFNTGLSGDQAPLRVAGTKTNLRGATSVAYDAVHDELYFAARSAIVVHAGSASGNTSPIRVIKGNLTQLGFFPRGITIDLAHDEVIVVDDGVVRTYDRGASGNVAPKRVNNPGGCLGINSMDISLDPVADELYIAEMVSHSVKVLNRTDSGAVCPKRTITGGLDYPASVAYAGGEIFVVNTNATSVRVFTPAGAFLREFFLPGTGGLGISVVGAEVFVGLRGPNAGNGYPVQGSVGVYTKTGTLLRTLTGAGDSIGQRGVRATAFDATRDALITVAEGQTIAIASFARTASGGAAPLTQLPAPDQRLHSIAGFVAYDAANARLHVGQAQDDVSMFNSPITNPMTDYLTSYGGFWNSMYGVGGAAVHGPANKMVVAYSNAIGAMPRTGGSFYANYTASFSSVARGLAVAPDGLIAAVGKSPTKVGLFTTNGTSFTAVATIEGAATGLVEPKGIAVDATSIYVLEASTGSILVFDRSASGNVAPVRTIAGAATFLSSGTGLIVDGGDLIVATATPPALRVFAPTASGNAAPLRSITGSQFGTLDTGGVALCQ